MSELNKFTRLFKNVKNCKNLNWQEKAILSEIISYQLDGKPFKVKDLTLAYELAMDKGSVSKFIRQLSLKKVITKNTVTYLSHSGGKPKRLRTIIVNEIEKWTDAFKTPVIEPIQSSPKKSQDLPNTGIVASVEELTKPSEPIIDIMVIPAIEESEAKPSIKPKVIKVESPEQMLEITETKRVAAISSTQAKSHDTSDRITLDCEKDIDNTTASCMLVINQIKDKMKIEFINVNVKFGDEFLPDEATLLQDGSNKYCLKSTLKALKPRLFNKV